MLVVTLGGSPSQRSRSGVLLDKTRQWLQQQGVEVVSYQVRDFPAEVWLQAQAFWVMRSIVIFTILALFAALWFIPLFFFYWDSALWVTGCTVAGVIFSAIAFLYLLNAWVQGLSKFFKNKAVF